MSKKKRDSVSPFFAFSFLIKPLSKGFFFSPRFTGLVVFFYFKFKMFSFFYYGMVFAIF